MVNLTQFAEPTVCIEYIMLDEPSKQVVGCDKDANHNGSHLGETKEGESIQW